VLVGILIGLAIIPAAYILVGVIGIALFAWAAGR
jgi:hypothetical protein